MDATKTTRWTFKFDLPAGDFGSKDYSFNVVTKVDATEEEALAMIRADLMAVINKIDTKS